MGGILIRCVKYRYGLLVGSVLLLSACYSTGNNFSSSGLDRLQPHDSTYQDAVTLLQSEPVNKYYRNDGTYMARWAHVNTLWPDAVYFGRELWFEFNAQNILTRMSKSHNVQQPVGLSPQVDH